MPVVASPVEDFTGSVVGVAFEGGVGETDEEGALAYFRRHGYAVAEEKAKRTTAAKA